MVSLVACPISSKGADNFPLNQGAISTTVRFAVGVGLAPGTKEPSHGVLPPLADHSDWIERNHLWSALYVADRALSYWAGYPTSVPDDVSLLAQDAK